MALAGSQSGASSHAGPSLFEDAFVRRVVEATDLVTLVGRRVDLKKSGVSYTAKCPFHTEKTASFSVSPAKGLYNCFGCGAGGDAVSFLMEYDGLPFREAIEELAQAAGIPLPPAEISPVPRENTVDIHEALERATKHYEEALRGSQEAIDYARSRGMTGQTAKHFRLGYAGDEWQTLRLCFPDYATSQSLADAGLIAEKNDRRYDRMRDRLIFPVRDLRGRVIAFGGRVLGTGEPKYLNSPETAVFRKGEVLYGLYEAHCAMRSQKGRKRFYVVEGYMDVVSLAQGGVVGAVATMGTAVSSAHVHQVMRFADEVVFVFDGDAAGDKAARAALEACLPHIGHGASFHFMRLADGVDPDDMIRSVGLEGWLALPRASVSEFLMRRAATGHDMGNADGRAAFLSEGKRLAQLAPRGSDFQRVLLADLHRAAGVSYLPGERRSSPLPSPTLSFQSHYERIARACERQPDVALKHVERLIGHLELVFGASEAPADAMLLRSCLERINAGALESYVIATPADVAILDGMERVLASIEALWSERNAASALANDVQRQIAGLAG